MLLKAKLILKDKFKKSRQIFMDGAKALEADFKKIFYEIICLEYASVMNRYQESITSQEQKNRGFDLNNNEQKSSILKEVTESDTDELVATCFNQDIDGFFEYQSEEPSLIEFWITNIVKKSP